MLVHQRVVSLAIFHKHLNVVKTMPAIFRYFLQLHLTIQGCFVIDIAAIYKNGDDWGMVKMALF